jgi:hypothetical protein
LLKLLKEWKMKTRIVKVIVLMFALTPAMLATAHAGEIKPEGQNLSCKYMQARKVQKLAQNNVQSVARPARGVAGSSAL